MNKLIAIPMAIGFAFLFIAILGGVSSMTVLTSKGRMGPIYRRDGNIQPVEIPDQEQTWSIMSAEGVMALLTIAIAVGIVGGITVFGSGISEYSQSIIFQTTVYVAIWAVCTLAIYDVVQSVPILAAIIWLSMTLMYAIGIIQEVKT